MSQHDDERGEPVVRGVSLEWDEVFGLHVQVAGGADEAAAVCAALKKGKVEAWADVGQAKRLERAGHAVVLVREANRREAVRVRAVLSAAGYAVKREKGGLKSVPCPYGARLEVLLGWGAYSDFEAVPTVAELGLSAEDVPELMRMAVDPEFGHTRLEDARGAPVWAWYLLGELNPPGAIPLLVGLLAPEGVDNGWASVVVPEVLSGLGRAAVPELAAVLRDERKKPLTRWQAAESLTRIGMDHPEFRAEVVAVIAGQLELYATQDETMNAMLVADLLDLRAVESAAVIEKAFAVERVAECVAGDWDSVQIELGFKARPKTKEVEAEDDGFEPLFGPEAEPAVEDRYAVAEAMDEEIGEVAPTSSAVRREGPKVGRNEPCPCGSGKKFKKCCGA